MKQTALTDSASKGWATRSKGSLTIADFPRGAGVALCLSTGHDYLPAYLNWFKLRSSLSFV